MEKIPIQNIYFLLCYAWDKLEEREIVNVSGIEHTKLVSLFTRVLLNGLMHLLKKGLDRGYVAHCEDTRSLRGKLDLNITLKRNLLSQGRVHCDYDDLHYDILHNQIIKTILRQLANHKELDDKLRDEVAGYYRRLHGISEIHLSNRVFRKVQLNHNNYFYDFLIKICELLHENMLIIEEAGESKFRDFVRDKLADLFENFVRNFYRRELKEKAREVRREIISWMVEGGSHSDLSYLPHMQTDISIEFENRKVIIDTKFYKNALQINPQSDKKTLISSNLYQMFAYLKNSEAKGGVNTTCEGILLYPTVNEELDVRYKVQGHFMRVKTLNLNQEWQQIHNELLSVVAYTK
jgi:5-methylcytosine-specific restriction enzyme subunit McrC